MKTVHSWRSIRFAATLAAAGFSVSAVTAAVATAQASAVRSVTHGGAAAASVRLLHLRSPNNVANNEFAGYTYTPLNGFASASTTFTIPSVGSDCSNSTFADADEQYGLSNINTSNARPLQAGVEIYCNGASAVYQYVAFTAAADVVEPATPGDTVVASMFQTGSFSEAEVHDLTNGQYWASTYGATSNIVSAGTGVILGVAVAFPLPSVMMSMCQVNGDYLGFDSPTANNYVSAVSGHTLISAGVLTAHGTDFKLVYKHTS